jgi:GR25 family glycosyltransferase involved in LPS biosynthesis
MITSYVISLKEPQTLFTTLSSHELNPVWIEGVNAKTLRAREIAKNTTPIFSIFCPPVAVAIGMSHIRAWKAFLKTNDPYAIIMEDDVILVDGFSGRLQETLQHIPADTDILYLGCFGCRSPMNLFTAALSFSSSTHEQINPFIDRPGVAMGTHAYLVTRVGAQRLLDLLEGRLFNHIDFCMQSLTGKGQLTTYVTSPRLAFQTSTDCGGKSTNQSNMHPRLPASLLSDIYLDEHVSASWMATLTILCLGPLHVTFFSVLFLLGGLVCAWKRTGVLILTLVFAAVSLAELVTWKGDPMAILFHYGLLVGPSLVSKHLL